MSLNLKDLEQKLLALKAKHTQKVRINKKKISGYSVALNILLELFAGLLVGAGLGYLLDKYLQTKYVFFIIFLFVGLLSGIFNMYRYLRKL